MSNQSQFFLGSLSSTALIETLELAHPNFTQTYWIVRNVAAGISLTLETSAVQAFQYYPCKISRLRMQNNLDSGFSIALGDVGTVLAKELDAVDAADGFATKPTVKYRAWRSDTTTSPLIGPIKLEISKVTRTFGASTFEAVAKRANVVASGELYQMGRFPMLRGTL